jgi:hypothetical protein
LVLIVWGVRLYKNLNYGSGFSELGTAEYNSKLKKALPWG